MPRPFYLGQTFKFVRLLKNRDIAQRCIWFWIKVSTLVHTIYNEHSNYSILVASSRYWYQFLSYLNSVAISHFYKYFFLLLAFHVNFANFNSFCLIILCNPLHWAVPNCTWTVLPCHDWNINKLGHQGKIQSFGAVYYFFPNGITGSFGLSMELRLNILESEECCTNCDLGVHKLSLLLTSFSALIHCTQLN